MFLSYPDVLSIFFFFKQKTAYELRISDWSSDVCSSDLERHVQDERDGPLCEPRRLCEEPRQQGDGQRQSLCGARHDSVDARSGPQDFAHRRFLAHRLARASWRAARPRAAHSLHPSSELDPDRKSVLSGKRVEVRVDTG